MELQYIILIAIAVIAVFLRYKGRIKAVSTKKTLTKTEPTDTGKTPGDGTGKDTKTPPPSPSTPEKPTETASYGIGTYATWSILSLIAVWIVVAALNDYSKYKLRLEQTQGQNREGTKKWAWVQDLDFSKNFHNENGKSWTTQLTEKVKLNPGKYRTDARFSLGGGEYNPPGIFYVKEPQAVHFLQDKTPRAELWKEEP